MNIQRNEPCYCGSSKKYKKCCYSVDQACRIPYQVSYDPLPGGPQEIMDTEDGKRFQEIAESLVEDQRAEKSFIPDLLVLKKKYPEVPQIYN